MIDIQVNKNNEKGEKRQGQNSLTELFIEVVL